MLGPRLASGASKAGTDNAFGDEQLDVDLAADKIIFDEFKVWLAYMRTCLPACLAASPRAIYSSDGLYRHKSLSCSATGRIFYIQRGFLHRPL